jgi:hypothetical protein
MDDQMKELIKTGYAGNQISIDFKDSNNKKTNGITNPAGYLNKTLSETVNQNLSDEAGYQFFGMSIMDGYHSVMIVVNNTDTANPTYNVLDQHGSMFSPDDPKNVNTWHTADELDTLLMDWTSNGNTTNSGGKGKTTTTITPILQKKEEE